jgi:hypothetical protein
VKTTFPPSPSSSESLATSNQKYKMNRKRTIKKNKSPTSTIHIGDVSLASASHAGGKKPASARHARRTSAVTTIHTNISSPTHPSDVGYGSKKSVNHVEGKKMTSLIHVQSEILVTRSHIGENIIVITKISSKTLHANC